MGQSRQWGWHRLDSHWAERLVSSAPVTTGSLVVDVVANPPFNITHALLRRLLQPGTRMRSATLVLQEQAARRWAGPTSPAVGRWGRDFEARLGPRIPRRAFRPSPRVDARVREIRRRHR